MSWELLGTCKILEILDEPSWAQWVVQLLVHIGQFASIAGTLGAEGPQDSSSEDDHQAWLRTGSQPGDDLAQAVP